MKIVIMGCGKVGHKLAEQLSQEEHDVVVIDQDSEALQTLANNEDVLCIEGNAVSYDVQTEAEVLVCERLLVGKVPEIYLDFGNFGGKLNLTP